MRPYRSPTPTRGWCCSTACAARGFTGKVAIAMHTPTDTEVLRAQGADVILTPFSDAAEFAVAALEKVLAPAAA